MGQISQSGFNPYRKLESREKEEGHNSTGSDDDGEKTSTGEAAGAGGDKKEKRLMAPRKKFEWTDRIRCDPFHKCIFSRSYGEKTDLIKKIST